MSNYQYIRSTRTPLGNYPKWLGQLVAWYLRKRLPKSCTILLRGRKPRVSGLWGHRHSIPLHDSMRVGLYLIQLDRKSKPTGGIDE